MQSRAKTFLKQERKDPSYEPAPEHVYKELNAELTKIIDNKSLSKAEKNEKEFYLLANKYKDKLPAEQLQQLLIRNICSCQHYKPDNTKTLNKMVKRYTEVTGNHLMIRKVSSQNNSLSRGTPQQNPPVVPQLRQNELAALEHGNNQSNASVLRAINEARESDTPSDTDNRQINPYAPRDMGRCA